VLSAAYEDGFEALLFVARKSCSCELHAVSCERQVMLSLNDSSRSVASSKRASRLWQTRFLGGMNVAALIAVLRIHAKNYQSFLCLGVCHGSLRAYGLDAMQLAQRSDSGVLSKCLPRGSVLFEALYST
jgi:hypothetical protein